MRAGEAAQEGASVLRTKSEHGRQGARSAVRDVGKPIAQVGVKSPAGQRTNANGQARCPYRMPGCGLLPNAKTWPALRGQQELAEQPPFAPSLDIYLMSDI